MIQTEGDANFIAFVAFTMIIHRLQSNKHRPPLKTAPVFGGIAGIVTSDQGESDDVGHMLSMSSKTREISKLQDMYRQTLAASWAAQAGELPADKCIEEIFAGGDGWGGNGPYKKLPEAREMSNSTEETENDESQAALRHHGRSPRYQPGAHRPQGNHRENSRDNSKGTAPNGVSGRKSIEQQLSSRIGEDERQDYARMRAQEVDEFSTREDLRSWKISVK